MTDDSTPKPIELIKTDEVMGNQSDPPDEHSNPPTEHSEEDEHVADTATHMTTDSLQPEPEDDVIAEEESKESVQELPQTPAAAVKVYATRRRSSMIHRTPVVTKKITKTKPVKNGTNTKPKAVSKKEEDTLRQLQTSVSTLQKAVVILESTVKSQQEMIVSLQEQLEREDKSSLTSQMETLKNSVECQQQSISCLNDKVWGRSKMTSPQN